MTLLSSVVTLALCATEMSLKVPQIAEVIEQIYDDLGLTIYWGAPTIVDGEYTEVMLMLTFEVYGPVMEQDAMVLTYATLPDHEKEDYFESVTCTAKYTNETGHSSEFKISNYYGNHTFLNDT